MGTIDLSVLMLICGQESLSKSICGLLTLYQSLYMVCGLPTTYQSSIYVDFRLLIKVDMWTFDSLSKSICGLLTPYQKISKVK